MDVGFASAGLAALCSSSDAMAERWGSDMGGVVGRRLLDLAAVGVANVERLPHAKLSTDGNGESTVVFANTIVVRGVISAITDQHRAAMNTEALLITAIEVHQGGDER